MLKKIKKKRVPFINRGTAPANSELVGENETGWQLFFRHAKYSKAKKPALWLNCKLISWGDVPHYANFWLAYNIDRREWLKNRDIDRLDTYVPGMKSWATVTLEKWWKDREKRKLEQLLS